jgi:hypothetical protein
MGIWMGKSGDSKGIICWDVLGCSVLLKLAASSYWEADSGRFLINAHQELVVQWIPMDSNGFQWSKIICFISPRQKYHLP